MAAPRNNQNAGKWTADRVMGQLTVIHRMAREPKQYFLGAVLRRIGLYKDVWAYWQRKFASDEQIMERMDLIRDCFESNLFTAALRSRLSAAFAIMCLKANYGWREDPQTEARDRTGDKGMCEKAAQLGRLMPGYSRAA